MTTLLTATATVTENVHQLDILTIKPSPYQPRKFFGMADLIDLAEDIRLNGLRQPVEVRATGISGFELVYGERRLRAYQLLRDGYSFQAPAQISEEGLLIAGDPNSEGDVQISRKADPDPTYSLIPALIREVDDEQAMRIALSENRQRVGLNAMEEALAYHAMLSRLQLNTSEFARRFGIARPTIVNRLRLLDLPGGIHDLFISGKLGQSAGIKLLEWQAKFNLPKEYTELLGRLIADNTISTGWFDGFTVANFLQRFFAIPAGRDFFLKNPLTAQSTFDGTPVLGVAFETPSTATEASATVETGLEIDEDGYENEGDKRTSTSTIAKAASLDWTTEPSPVLRETFAGLKATSSSFEADEDEADEEKSGYNLDGAGEDDEEDAEFVPDDGDEDQDESEDDEESAPEPKAPMSFPALPVIAPPGDIPLVPAATAVSPVVAATTAAPVPVPTATTAVAIVTSSIDQAKAIIEQARDKADRFALAYGDKYLLNGKEPMDEATARLAARSLLINFFIGCPITKHAELIQEAVDWLRAYGYSGATEATSIAYLPLTWIDLCLEELTESWRVIQIATALTVHLTIVAASQTTLPPAQVQEIGKYAKEVMSRTAAA